MRVMDWLFGIVCGIGAVGFALIDYAVFAFMFSVDTGVTDTLTLGCAILLHGMLAALLVVSLIEGRE